MYISCFSALNNGLLLITIVNIWNEKKKKKTGLRVYRYARQRWRDEFSVRITWKQLLDYFNDTNDICRVNEKWEGL